MKQAEKIKLGAGIGILVVALLLIGWQTGLFGGRDRVPPAPAQVDPADQRGGGARGAGAPLQAQ